MNIDLRGSLKQIICEFLFENLVINRKKLFEIALTRAKSGKVLYILQEELNELPELSQDLSSINRHYMKMISFIYTKNLDLLIESISTLPDWQNIPSTIILDNLNGYCSSNHLQTACGVVAFLLNTVYSCATSLNSTCNLYISADKNSELYNLKL